jgi:putative YhbY family RNA-binding protein
MKTLTPAFRRELRARAHHLHPVVAIGQHGLTPAVLHEIDAALTAHELIKLRVFSDDRAEREVLLARICDELACAPVQHLGKLLILWRKREEPAVEAPRAKKSAKPPRAQPKHAPEARPAAKGRRPRAATTAEPASGSRRPRSAAASEPAAGTRRRRSAAAGAGAPAGVPRAAAPRRRRAR